MQIYMYANTVPFYITSVDFVFLRGSGANTLWILRDDYTVLSCKKGGNLLSSLRLYIFLLLTPAGHIPLLYIGNILVLHYSPLLVFLLKF